MKAVWIAVLLALVISGCGGADVELDKSEPWDLVWFSDSLGWDVAEAWADRIEEVEGVEVRVHDHAVGNLSAVLVRTWLTDEPTIREEVAGAEVIVVNGNPEGSGATDDMKTCVSAMTLRRDPPERYALAEFEPYADVLRDIYDVIFELRAGQPTVIRAVDDFSGVLASWREAGIDVECTAAWGVWADVIENTADEYGVVTAAMYDAFNGADHDEDPREKGFIRSDGIHASPEGLATQVEVLHALGYAPIIP